MGGGSNAPGEVAAVMAHPSSGSTCGGRAEARDDVQQWRRRSGDGWRRWQGPAVLKEKGEDEAHANCEPRRTEDRLTEETEIDAGGGSDIR
jgi:hypothetical protein